MGQPVFRLRVLVKNVPHGRVAVALNDEFKTHIVVHANQVDLLPIIHPSIR
jgi:hypothetical protein